jgi:acyl carrier protein
MTQDEATRWIADIFEEPVEHITPATQREAIPGWDSMGVLALMAALDKDFDIVLSPEDIKALKKVGDIMELLQRNGKMVGEAV